MIHDPVAITVDKARAGRAGMGGGSADAAAVLRGLARLHSLRSTRSPRCGGDDGSDVPALVHGGPVFAEGRGERLTALHAVASHWVVLPLSFVVRTPDAYASWNEDPAVGPHPGALIAGEIETGRSSALGAALVHNSKPPSRGITPRCRRRARSSSMQAPGAS